MIENRQSSRRSEYEIYFRNNIKYIQSRSRAIFDTCVIGVTKCFGIIVTVSDQSKIDFD